MQDYATALGTRIMLATRGTGGQQLMPTSPEVALAAFLPLPCPWWARRPSRIASEYTFG